MKVTCEWLVLAERILQDATSNNLTIVSCLEQVQALHFPSRFNGFGVAALYRCEDAPPQRDRKVKYRLTRISEHDPDEEIFLIDSTWERGVNRARLATNFDYLRLKRPETLRFRLDHKVGRGEWEHGPTCTLDVLQMELSAEQLQALREEAALRGLSQEELGL